MKQYNKNDKIPVSVVNEEPVVYESREALEEARLRQAINKTDTEKFYMFTRMMRITMMLKKARIIHKQG